MIRRKGFEIIVIEYDKDTVPEYYRLSSYTLHYKTQFLCFLSSKVPPSSILILPGAAPYRQYYCCTIRKSVLSLPSLAASDRRSKEGKAVSNSPHGAVTTHVSQSADSDL